MKTSPPGMSRYMVVKIIQILGGLIFLLATLGCSKPGASVVVYCSQDQIYAEQIFNDFEQETGIDVKAVFDTESVKTAGLANRLRFEKNNPQCDLFWNNEEMHTRALGAEGLFSEEIPWSTVGYRSRKLIYNIDKLSAAELPKSLLELTNATWQGKLALAFPLFGTTSYHFLALRQHWGDEVWFSWCKGLVHNGAKVVDGNSMVVKLVAAGEAVIGLTDSDDVAVGLKQGFQIAAHEIQEATLFIPNTVAIVRGAKHLDEALKLKSYLSQPGTIQKLVNSQALEGVAAPREVEAISVNWNEVDVQGTVNHLGKVFLRQ